MDVLEILRPALDEQRQCVRFGQAKALGVSRAHVRAAVTSARLERVRRGVYGLPAERDRLVEAQLATAGVVSHTSAAKQLGIALAFDDPEVHLTFPRDYGRPRDSWCRTHRSDVSADEVVLVAGLRCTTAVRTVLDLARSLPLAEAVAAADSALRDGMTTVAELESALAALPAPQPRHPQGAPGPGADGPSRGLCPRVAAPGAPDAPRPGARAHAVRGPGSPRRLLAPCGLRVVERSPRR